MPIFLEIAVNVPQVVGTFHYHLPPELENRVLPGHLVVVPFGPQLVQGIVLRQIDEPAVPKTRPIKELLDPETVLTPAQMALAEHLAAETLSPLAACIALMLPQGLAQQADTLFSLASDAPGPDSANANPLNQTQMRLIKLLQRRGPLRGRQINRAMPRVNWRNSAAGLTRRGLVTRKSVLPPPTVRPKHVRTAQLAIPPEEAEKALDTLGKKGSKALLRRQAILRLLLREPGPVNVAWVYAESGGNLSDLHNLADKGIVILGETEIWRDPLADVQHVRDTVPPLTPDQLRVWERIRTGFKKLSRGEPVLPILVHGVTGSGKTEIYLRAVAETLQRKRQAIVLVPEIALTPQTVRRFMSRFPGQIGLVHSKLSPGERYDTWRRAKDGLLSVIVGPRSALFTPLPDLGLIVVDECHDGSYYQSEPPFYHAREAAIAYARLAKAVCLMGSATPEVTSYYLATQGKRTLLSLPSRILAHKETIRAYLQQWQEQSGSETRPELGAALRYQPFYQEAEAASLPPVRLVDMRQELKAGNRSIFSRTLQETLGQTLVQGQQAILFLNRRGTATYVFCRDCGHALQCPRCADMPLTYHRSGEALTCHHCGYRRKMPARCPECGGRRIRHYGTGTERVESEVQALFPTARTLRWDWETTRTRGAHDIIMSHFANHRADVLIGTQMLAKGLDLPLVTLVGIVLADVGLHLPDYRAGERTFQVLSQVAGRAGRSPLGGQIVLQTFHPDHYVIQSVVRHDFRGFYQQELAHRRKLGYPPFSHLVRLEYRHPDSGKAEAAAKSMAIRLRHRLKSEDRRQTELIGPAPCFFARLNRQFRWQIILRGPDPADLLRGQKMDDWRVETTPLSLL